MVAEVRDGADGPELVRLAGDGESPVNEGELCPLGAAVSGPEAGAVEGPMRRAPGSSRWEPVEWEEALEAVARRLMAARDATWNALAARADGLAIVGGPALTNEEAYLSRKVAAALGSPWVEGAAASSVAPAVALLESCLGLGAPTNHPKDLKNARAVLAVGADPAGEAPMAMRWIEEARRRGAVLLVADGRFHSTAERADRYLRIRPGTEAVLLDALVREVLEEGLCDGEYVNSYTNALVELSPAKGDAPAWRPALDDEGAPARVAGLDAEGSVFAALRRRFAPHTAEAASVACGVPAREIRRLARTLAELRPAAVVLSPDAARGEEGIRGVRSSLILQLLLGNVGMPGGGLHPATSAGNVQGVVDNGLLRDRLPGGLPAPREGWGDLEAYAREAGEVSRDRLVSQLRAWFGEEAHPGNEFGYGWLPRLDPERSHAFEGLREGLERGDLRFLALVGEGDGPRAIGRSDRLGSLETLVVVDRDPTPAAAFWDEPEAGEAGARTEVWFLPAAGFLEKAGCMTSSGRCVQGRDRVLPAAGGRRDELAILDGLFRGVRELCRLRLDPKDEPVLSLRWEYGSPPEHGAVLREMAGEAEVDLVDGKRGRVREGGPLPEVRWVRGDGTTSCGNWLYAGCGCAADGEPADRSRARETEDPTGLGLHPGWGWALPDNARILYGRASADREGRPRDSERVLVWWDEAEERWLGHTPPGLSDPRAAPGGPGSSPFPYPEGGQARLYATEHDVPEGAGDPARPARASGEAAFGSSGRTLQAASGDPDGDPGLS
jgi:formate dehydrogenase major subunit